MIGCELWADRGRLSAACRVLAAAAALCVASIPLLIAPRPAAGESYALLFSGGGDVDHNEPRYYENIKNFYWALLDLNFRSENIYIYSADGTDPAVDQSDGTNSNYWWAAINGITVQEASPLNLQNRLADMAARVDESDTFLFWSFDHGNGAHGDTADHDEETLAAWGVSIPDEDVASWIAPINAGRQAYIFGQCFAGGILEELDLTPAGRFGCAATNHYEDSWEDGFVAALTEGIRSEGKTTTHAIYDYAYDHDPFATDGQGPGGSFRDGVEHPWRTGDNFDLAVGHWFGGGSTENWSDSGNWADDVLPDGPSGHSRTVRIVDPKACQVDGGGTHSLFSLLMHPGTTVRVVDGSNVETRYLEIDGTLRIVDGRVAVMLHTRNADPAAEIDVFGDGELWSSYVTGYSGSLIVAGGSAEAITYDGTGTVYVHSGGTLAVWDDVTLGAGSELTLLQPGTMVDIDGNARLDGEVSVSGSAVLDVEDDARLGASVSVLSSAELRVGGDLHLGEEGPIVGEIDLAALRVGHDMYVGEGGPVTVNVNKATVDVGYRLFHEQGTLSATLSTLNVNGLTYIDGGFEDPDHHLEATLALRGSVLTTQCVYVAYNFGGTGRITLDEELLADPEIRTTEGVIMVGRNGLGEITQNAGTVSCEAGSTDYADVTLGGAPTTEGWGIYRLNRGTLEADELIVGWNGVGEFTQTGGTCRVHRRLTIADLADSEGTCTLGGGEFEVPEIDDGLGTSTLNIDGGALTVTGDTIDVDTLALASGVGTHGQFDLADKRLTCELLAVGVYGRGDFDLGPGAGVLANTEMIVGQRADGNGDVMQTGGYLRTPELLIGMGSMSEGRYDLQGGTLNADSITVAVHGRGRLVQSNDAEVTTNELTVGQFNGSSTNHYLQSGGTTLVRTRLTLGDTSGGRGAYYLGWLDPTVHLTTQWTEVGVRGTGEFEHRRGTHEAIEGVILGQYLGAEGTYALEDGQLNTPLTTVVQGLFHQTGGMHSVGLLTVGGGLLHPSRYELSDLGQLGAGEVRLGYYHSFDMGRRPGTLTQTGGSHHVSGDFYLGYDHSCDATVEQSGGTGQIDGNLYVAYAADTIATYTLGGGTEPGDPVTWRVPQHVAGELHVGYGEDSEGTFILQRKTIYVGGETYAGQLTVDGPLAIGGLGGGHMEVRAGARLYADAALTVGSATDPGTLLLDGGDVEGAGSMTITAGQGELRGSGSISLPVVNNHHIQVAYMSFQEDVSGPGTIALDGELDQVCFYSSATLDGAVTNNGRFLVANFGASVVRLRGGMGGTGSVEVSGTLEIDSGVSASSLATSGFAMGTIVQQVGSSVDVQTVSVGSMGRYELHDTAVLGVESTVTVNGDFDQLGGTHAAGTLSVAKSEMDYMRTEPARYRLAGGWLSAAVLEIGGEASSVPGPPGPPMGPSTAGELAIEDPAAVVTVSERLVLNETARLSPAPGAQIHMTGSALENYSSDAPALAGLGELELIFEGGPATVDPFEVAGQDRRELPCGLRDNFVLGTLSLGSASEGVGQVQLVDLFDNQPDTDGAEALYVDHLSVAAGSSLDLGGLSLYYVTAHFDPGTGAAGTPIYWPTTHAVVEGTPAGFDVDVAMDPGGSGGMGVAGMAGGDPSALSCTITLDEGDLSAAIGALGSADAFVTLKVYYDEHELEILDIAETTLRPYWWDETAGLWVLCGTTTDGLSGEGVFAGIDVDPTGYGIGYCGLDSDENFLWAHINHASEYTAGGEVPEPATVWLLFLAAACLLGWWWRGRSRSKGSTAQPPV